MTDQFGRGGRGTGGSKPCVIQVFCPSERIGGYYKTALSITGLFFSSGFLAMAAPVGAVKLIDRILVFDVVLRNKYVSKAWQQ